MEGLLQRKFLIIISIIRLNQMYLFFKDLCRFNNGQKFLFSVLAEDAIKAALNDYQIKQESLTRNQKQ